MGGFFNGLFGGGPSMPSMLEQTPIPLEEDAKDPEARAVRESEQRKLRARRALSGTLLTNPLGQNQSGNAGGILGK